MTRRRGIDRRNRRSQLRACRQRRRAGLSGPHHRIDRPLHAGLVGRHPGPGPGRQHGGAARPALRRAEQARRQRHPRHRRGRPRQARRLHADAWRRVLDHRAAADRAADRLHRRNRSTPICQTFKNDQVIVARPGTYKTLADLMAASKAKSGGLNYGSPGLGTIPHLSMAELSQISKVEFNHVPFKGPAESIQMTHGRPDRIRRGAADRGGQQRACHARPVRREAQPVDPRRADREGAGLRRRAAEHRRAVRRRRACPRTSRRSSKPPASRRRRASRSSASSRTRSSRATISPTARALRRT